MPLKQPTLLRTSHCQSEYELSNSINQKSQVKMDMCGKPNLSRQCSQNLLEQYHLHEACHKGNATRCETPKEFSTSLFSHSMTELIKLNTNGKITLQRFKYKSKNNSAFRDLCSEELNCLIWVFIMVARLRDNHLSIRTMMDTHLCGDKYHAAFSQFCMEFLLNCPCFNDWSTRDDARRAESKLALISTLWSMLMTNCTKYYSPGSYMTIDEQFVEF